MHLREAIEEILGSTRILTAEEGTKQVLDTVTRFLLHHGHEDAARALEFEHMP